MGDPTFKIVLAGDDYDLEMCEIEPGTLQLLLVSQNDPQSGAYIELPTEQFTKALEKLLSD